MEWISLGEKSVRGKGFCGQRARVTENMNGLTAYGREEHKNICCYTPWGVVCVPPKGEEILLFSVDGLAACMGTRMQRPSYPLEEGELSLFSKGGASILLKNSGEVIINGRVFPPAEKKEGGKDI